MQSFLIWTGGSCVRQQHPAQKLRNRWEMTMLPWAGAFPAGRLCSVSNSASLKEAGLRTNLPAGFATMQRAT